MHNKTSKKELLEQFKKNPNVTAVCGRAGISTSTFYRWCQKSKEFKKQVDEAMEAGRQTINDFAESQLIQAIKDRSIPAIKYWLDNNHKKYSKKMIEISGSLSVKEELTPEQEALIKKALALAGLNDESYDQK